MTHVRRVLLSGQMTNIDEVLGVTSPEAADHERTVTEAAAAVAVKKTGRRCQCLHALVLWLIPHIILFKSSFAVIVNGLIFYTK